MRPENPLGEPLMELSEVDSTNNYAMLQLQAQMAGHGNAFMAHYQTAGKGQRGKIWNATRGQNIMLSVIIEPHLSIDKQFLLTMAMALGCHDFFSAYAPDHLTIKWPNDIYWKDRKAGGILIENIIQGVEWRYAVVGIGLNINQTLFPDMANKPVSLRQITSKAFEVPELAAALCKCLDKRWRQLTRNEEAIILQSYNKYLFKLNELAQLKKENKIFTAKVKGVNAKGELLLNDDHQPITFGSVEWVMI